MFKGIIFDVDGVLFDTEPLHVKAWIETADKFGIKQDAEYFNRWIGIPCSSLAADLVEKGDFPFSAEDILSEKEKLFSDLLMTEDYFSDEIREYLDKICSIVPVAWATTSPRKSIDIMFERADIMKYFSCGVCYEDVVNTKPDPEPYLKAASCLGLDPSGCAAVDDSPSGTQSASGAGLYTVGISSCFTAEELGSADRHFSSTSEAMEWIIKTLVKIQTEK